MLTNDPYARFAEVFARAQREYPAEPNAMVLSTVGADGRPSSRVVLLKGFDPQGFVFYTNLESRKGRELAGHPFAALCFYWQKLEQQVRIEGPVQPVTPAEADAYFASRPRGSQLGAWASAQSQPLRDRGTLEARVAELETRYQGQEIPRPPHWSGFRLVPEVMEFWTARPSRLHERLIYRRAAQGWDSALLYP